MVQRGELESEVTSGKQKYSETPCRSEVSCRTLNRFFNHIQDRRKLETVSPLLATFLALENFKLIRRNTPISLHLLDNHSSTKCEACWFNTIQIITVLLLFIMQTGKRIPFVKGKYTLNIKTKATECTVLTFDDPFVA